MEIQSRLKLNKKFICFFTGVMTMVHMIIIFPYELYALVIVALVFIDFFCMKQHNIRLFLNTTNYLSWYGVFVLYVYLSTIYTVNTINPDYVLKRVIVIFALGFLVSRCVKDEASFSTLANGLVAGACICGIIAILNEGERSGIGRIGKATIGSAVALSGILLVGCICSIWRIVFYSNNRKIFLFLGIFQFVLILLTGSRRAIMLTLMFIPLLLLLNKNINRTKKMAVLLIALIVVLVTIYLIFNNSTLYSLVGWRFESMLSTFTGKPLPDDASMLERNIMRDYAVSLFNQRPILGYGVHGFAYKFNIYYGKLLYSHDGFVEILSCYGIVGFVLYYRVFFMIYLRFRRIRKQLEPSQIMLASFALMTLLTEMYTISFLTPQVVVMLTAGLCRLNYEKSKYPKMRLNTKRIQYEE